ncbi:hypothetical protein AB0C77_36810 [Streptomyces sp. NPDC048629]|uniref:hypothetical protein n=1 Tax=Streptomyces sp. NPDC048629 TaxID=3154824 RepID=UPI003416161C
MVKAVLVGEQVDADGGLVVLCTGAVPQGDGGVSTPGQNASDVRGTTGVWLACLSARVHALIGDACGGPRPTPTLRWSPS